MGTLTAPRHLAVLAYLGAARPYGLHSRDTIAALLWPESSQAHARHALRNVLHAIRRALGADVIVSAGDNLVGLNAECVECDVVVFSDLVRSSAEQALALCVGPFLEGLYVANAPAFEQWVDSERRHLVSTATSAARDALGAYRIAGDKERALTIAQRAHHIAPDDERLLCRLLDLLVESGDRRTGEDVLAAHAARNAREYGMPPNGEAADIVRAVRHIPVRQRMRSVSDAAFTLYVRGTYIFLRALPIGDRAELERSREFFEEALALQEDFAPALAGLANFHAVAAVRNLRKPFATAFQRAIELSHQALALDDTLAIPHVHFGVEAMYLSGDWQRAHDEFLEATQLDPGYAEGHRFLGTCLAVTRGARAGLPSFREAVRLEPHIALFRNALSDAYMSLGEYDEAVVHLERALTLEPRYDAARDRLARCHERLGDYAKAIAERREQANGHAAKFEAAFRAHGAAGYEAERQNELRTLIETVSRGLSDAPENAADILNPPQLRLALACAELGEWGAARDWMEHACARRPGQRQWFLGNAALSELSD